MSKSSALSGLKVTVIGAGPGGLTFAKSAGEQGAEVLVIEKAGDPRTSDPGYTDRSFNLTLNQVGRRVLGDKAAWRGSTQVRGRAVHVTDKDVHYASYGSGDAAFLTSVPRPALRVNLVEMVEKLDVKILFRCNVDTIDHDLGRVHLVNEQGVDQFIDSDLIVVADGIHSLADTFIKDKLHGSLKLREEALCYIAIMLRKEACAGMSLHHIHFWQQSGRNAVAIGLPNKDGTIAALLISKFDSANAEDEPFTSLKQTDGILRQDFPLLLNLEPNLAEQLINRKKGHFHYKSIENYILGKKSVVVGDAGSASPPWAGFGANTAIYGADALVRFIVGLGDLEQALKGYEQHKRVLAELVLDYAYQHGEFLNKQVVNNPSARPIGPILGNLINKAIEDFPVQSGVHLLSF